MLNTKSFKCLFCEKKYVSKQSLYEHMGNEHNDNLEGLSPAHYYFDYKNRNTKHMGKCTECGKPTEFNETTEKYNRLCKNPKCKEAYVEKFRKRMYAKGRDPINDLKDRDRQLKMLANRKISGEYKWSDGKKFTYTGTYEKNFLEYLDKVLEYPSVEVHSPAPQCYTYTTNDGKKHFYMPDVYLSDVNLLIEIKGSQSGSGYRDRDLGLETLKESAVMEDVKAKKVNYIKVLDKKYDEVTEKINELRENS
jgi:hypothetical protein